MWKNKDEVPSKNADYPAVIHPTFQREEGVDLGTFRETLYFYNGNWYNKGNHSLDVCQWELVAWFDVPEYQ